MCIFFGYSNIGYQALKTLLAQNHSVQAVYTHPDNPDETQWFDSVYTLAKQNNIPVFTHTPSVQELDTYNTPIALSAYYRNMLPTQWLLDRPLGAYNIHGSLLPKYRGAQPTNWAVICGDTNSGITLHMMAEKMDAGDIINQKSVDIRPTDTAKTVMDKITALTPDLITEVWDTVLQKTAIRTPQDDTQATVFPRRTPADGKIDFRATATAVHNLVRGVTHPYPGAFFMIGTTQIFVWETAVVDIENGTAQSGDILCEAGSTTIKCGDKAIEILSATQHCGADALPLLKAGKRIEN